MNYLHIAFRTVSALTLLIAVGAAASNLTPRTLDRRWQFRLMPGVEAAVQHADATTWRPARVPGSAQMDRRRAKLIPASYYRNNEAKLQWIGLTNEALQLIEDKLNDRPRKTSGFKTPSEVFFAFFKRRTS